MNSKQVYSPRQVYVGSFFGGPFAGLYFIKKNFDVLENKIGAKLSLLIGVICILGITGLIFVLPENFPNMLLPMLYSAFASGIAWQFQVSKEEEAVNEAYSFISNWSVVKVSLVAFVVYLSTLIALIFVASGLGFELRP